MIIHSFYNRLTNLQFNGVEIKHILDIGAHQGDFTATIHSVWPYADVIQIEADERQQYYLQDNAIIALLGDMVKEVDFYTLPPEKITTGSSIFKELTHHYDDCEVIKKQMTTIDILTDQYDFSGDWYNHGFIKIDTQGSELLILDGAKNFLTTKKPRYILLECSVLPYNQDAPLVSIIIQKLEQLNYIFNDVFDLAYDNQGRLLQLDILFTRNNI